MDENLKISEDVTYEFIDKNIYILNINDGEYYKLSESASEIWREIDQGINIDQLKIKFKSSYLDNKTIEDDIDEILRDFVSHGLIEGN
tara:strand:- start:5 stop:268 length:264 start_codon:yes stop_codon:yes gene_type:complete